MRVSQQTRQHRSHRRTVQLVDLQPGADEFFEDALTGLTAFAKKSVPGKYLYDDLGSWLYAQICALPGYSPMRAELAISRRHAPAIAAAIGRGATLIELGAGAGANFRELAPHLRSLAAYVPVDISRAPLLTGAESLAFEHPRLPVIPVCADFTRPLPPLELGAERTVVSLAGATLGGLDDAEAVLLLRRLTRVVGPTGGLLVGVDHTRDPELLGHACNDPQGLTAAFHLNLLPRLNRELGADFDVAGFRHRAALCAADGRVETHLVCLRDQVVHLGPYSIDVAEGETIRTDSATKHTPMHFAALVAAAGLRVHESWSGAGPGDFRLYFLKSSGAAVNFA